MESSEFLKLMQEMSDLKKSLSAINEAKLPSHCSEELQELFAALAKAQTEMEVAGLNASNPYFKSKYADLASIVRASRPCLSKNGLAVLQQIIPTAEGQNMLHTRLCHSSGQWIESVMRIVPPKNDVQTIGSYITYLRRYSYASLVGIVTADEDDDGEVSMIESRDIMAKGPSLKATPHDAKKESYETISKDQLDELDYELTGHLDLVSEIMDKMGLQSLADMPKSKYNMAIRRVRELKQLREGK